MPKARHPKAEPFVREGLFTNLKDFGEFERRVAALSDTKSRGDAFEQLVKAYLLLEPEYASKLKHVWLHREVPQSKNAGAIPVTASLGSADSAGIAS